jgi:hypothetical protein
MRKTSLILSNIPFVVALVMIAMLFSAQGYDGFRVLVAMLFAAPVLMVMSAIGLILAFRKTTNLALDQAAKVTSIISVAIFGTAGVLSVVIFLNTMNSYSNLGPDVIYHG